MKKLSKATIILLSVIAIISQGLTIFITNTSAADSITASEITLKTEKLEEENIDLQSQILSFASYERVASRAAELGYENSRDFVSVYTPLPVAFGR